MRTYNVTQVAVELGLSPETIYKMVNEKRLNCSKVGNRFVITEKDVEDFLEGTKVGKGEK